MTAGLLALGMQFAASAHADVGAGAMRFTGTATGGVRPASQPTDLPLGIAPYTIEAWVKPTGNTNHGVVAWGGYGGGSHSSSVHDTIALRTVGTSAFKLYWWYDDLDVSTGNVTDGSWHHVAATWDGTTRKFYYDGTLMGSLVGARSDPVTNENFSVGFTGGFGGFDERFVGDMGELRIWTVARTQVEINSAMNSDLAGNESGLVTLYEFEDGVGASTAADGAGTSFPLVSFGTNSIVATGLAPAAAAIPTLSEWGMIVMFALLGGAMFVASRRRGQLTPG